MQVIRLARLYLAQNIRGGAAQTASLEIGAPGVDGNLGDGPASYGTTPRQPHHAGASPAAARHVFHHAGAALADHSRRQRASQYSRRGRRDAAKRARRECAGKPSLLEGARIFRCGDQEDARARAIRKRF